MFIPDQQEATVTDRTEDILARALDRRQREIEDDLRREGLEYRHQVNSLRKDLADMRISESRFQDEVRGRRSSHPLCSVICD